MDGTDGAESTGDGPPPDPRIEIVAASYGFDSGCMPYQSTSITVEVRAVDAPIERVELASYSVGYMSGVDVWLGEWGGADALPLAIGDSAELEFHDAEDGWAGECGDFVAPSEGAPLDAVFAIDGEEIVLAGNASIGCGWSEC